MNLFLNLFLVFLKDCPCRGSPHPLSSGRHKQQTIHLFVSLALKIAWVSFFILVYKIQNKDFGAMNTLILYIETTNIFSNK